MALMAGGCQSDYHPDDCNCKDCKRSACFPCDTLIDTPYGKTKIRDLKKGQLVMSYENGRLVACRITHKLNYGNARIMRVGFQSGNVLRTTEHHSFLTDKGWKKASELRVGDAVMQANTMTATVKSITKEEIQPVFNIYTARPHTFIAEGFIAHNFTEFRQLRTFLHQVFLDPFAPQSKLLIS